MSAQTYLQKLTFNIFKNIKVEQNDFDYAFKNDIKPAFGVKDNKLQQFIVNGIINWSKKIEKIMRDGRDLTQTAAQGTKIIFRVFPSFSAF